jgi:hypothetical protein
LKELEESHERLKARRTETSKKWGRVLQSRLRKTEDWSRIHHLTKEVEQLISERDHLAQEGMEEMEHHEKNAEESRMLDDLLRSTEKSIRSKGKMQQQMEKIELENSRMRASISHVEKLMQDMTPIRPDKEDATTSGD